MCAKRGARKKYFNGRKERRNKVKERGREERK
jgi:hypothetical protein